MTWSLPDGSRISGFHSEECFWREQGVSQAAQGTHTALPGTWPASPGRWCCWPCTRTRPRPRARGCAPRCARPASAQKGSAVKRARNPLETALPQENSRTISHTQGSVGMPLTERNKGCKIQGCHPSPPQAVFSSPVCHQSSPSS
uniref:Uncharacterized protein n=1 Tax=Ficedula albicollis TaxID=59894 RepID=A0A803VTR8_FICAL